jgi:biopolymer transport protein ExbD
MGCIGQQQAPMLFKLYTLSAPPSEDARTMDQIVTLKIVDDLHVWIEGKELAHKTEIVAALRQIIANRPDVTLSIEAEKSGNYQALGKAIYASQSAGFGFDNVRIMVEGKIMPAPV